MTRPDSNGHSAADSPALQTLGAAALVAVSPAGAQTPIFGPSKPLALLVYLASAPGGSATREFLIDLLWADLDPDAGRHAFRQTLWYIKQKLGRPLIRASADVVTLAEPLPSDRATFLEAVDARKFDAAVCLYGGDFLPDFAAPGGLEFEHWLNLERQRLRDVFARSAEHVVRHHLSIAHHREAVALARRLRDIDPLNEKSWRLLLEALASANDSLGASLEADALEHLLADDDREPEPATTAMLRTVRQLRAKPTDKDGPPPTLATEIVGREAEFSNILSAWDDARAGKPRQLFIVGPAGIGKTRLIADAAARLRARHSRVVWVRANPGEREIAYSLLSKLAAALAELPGAAAVSPQSASALVALNPTLSGSFSAAPDRAEGAEALRRRTIAIRELLASAADESPVAVIVDDLHWADRESALGLAGVEESLERERVLLVTAARPSGGLAGGAPRQATTIRLLPLKAADIGALLAGVAVLPDSPTGARLPQLIFDASNGLPLFVLEMLQLLIERELLAIVENAWVIRDEPGLAEALRAGGALRRRIDTLDRIERSVLNTLAVAGVPVPAGFIGDVVERPLADVAAILYGLEVRGIVNHVGDGWEPAHDQIGEMALDGLASGERRQAETAVGRAWLNNVGDDRSLRRAGMHFIRAGDELATSRAFVSWARRLRRLDDHRSPGALAAEFLDRDDAEQARALVRALPLRYRYGSTRWRIAATIVFVAVASAATTWQWTRQPDQTPDEQFLAVTVDSTGDTTVYRVPIRRDHWYGGDLLVPSREGRRVRTALPTNLGNYTVAADGKAWISAAPVADSGGDELMLEPMSGGHQRLTWSPGDDEGADLSPDGSRIAFSSGRFDAMSHDHIAVMDLAAGAVHQLTSGTAKDGPPKWSPDGLLIAYGRVSFADAADSVCTMTPAGAHQRCIATAAPSTIRGWIDANRILYSAKTDTLSTLGLMDVRDGSSRRLFRTGDGSFFPSPDGRWVFCLCRGSAASRYESIVFPVDHPELARTVAENPLDTRPLWLLWPQRRPADYVSALQVSVPASGVQLGVAYRFPLVGVTANGERIALPVATMESLDTTIARVLPGSRLLPVATGTARVVITASGWRTDTISIPVTDPHDSIVLSDDWSNGMGRNFVPFGLPAPVVTKDAAGHPAFWNRGDGDFTSGVYTRASFSGTQGVGLETMVSAPITAIGQWQTAALALLPLRDSLALARWDAKTGYLPIEQGLVVGDCKFQYPSDEGAQSIRTMSVAQTIVNPDTLFTKPLTDGRWYRVRVQVFSDGRCGVAVNGRVIALTAVGSAPTAPYVAVIDGNSFRTRILTGPVQVWTGVRPGVDWLAFDTSRATPRRKVR